MNASGPGQSPGRVSGGRCPPEAEVFLSPSMPKTQCPGTLALNHVYLLDTYSNNNSKDWSRTLKNWWGQLMSYMCASWFVKLDVLKNSLQTTARVQRLIFGLV